VSQTKKVGNHWSNLTQGLLDLNKFYYQFQLDNILFILLIDLVYLFAFDFKRFRPIFCTLFTLLPSNYFDPNLLSLFCVSCQTLHQAWGKAERFRLMAFNSCYWQSSGVEKRIYHYFLKNGFYLSHYKIQQNWIFL